MKLILSTLVALSMSTSAFADQNFRVGGVSISGGGLSLVGTISTVSLDDKHAAFTYVGWTLIVVGLLLDHGDLILNTANASEYRGQDIWDAIIREAAVVSRSPQLAKEDTAIVNASNQLGVAPAELATLALKIDTEVKVAESKGQQIDASKIAAVLYPNGFTDTATQNAFNNMIALASMR